MTMLEALEAGTGVGERRKGLEDVDETVVSVEEAEMLDVVESVEAWRDLRRKGTEGSR
jgi:hypothetical protein